MKKSKGMQLGVLLAAVLLVGLFASVASAQTPVPTSVPTVDNVTVDTKNNDGNLSPSKEVQKLVFDAIEASDLTDAEKKDLIKKLKDIWSGKSDLTPEEQQQVLIKVGEIISKAQVGIMWQALQHSDIARASGVKSQGTSWAVPQQYLQTLYDEAPKPDDILFDGQSAHAWNIDTNSGDAPLKVKNYANAARDLIKYQNNPSQGYKTLAYSMHYMADVGVPFHTDSTGNCWTGGNCLRHIAYESFVNNHWNTGHDFNATVRNDWYYYYITDPEATTKDVANGAHQYYNYIVNRMGSSNWENDSTLVYYTRESLKYASRGNLGLVNYVNR